MPNHSHISPSYPTIPSLNSGANPPMFFCSLPIRTRVCLKIAFGKLCVSLCGRFASDEEAVAGYVDRIGAKYTAKWGVQLVGMNF